MLCRLKSDLQEGHVMHKKVLIVAFAPHLNV